MPSWQFIPTVFVSNKDKIIFIILSGQNKEKVNAKFCHQLATLILVKFLSIFVYRKFIKIACILATIKARGKKNTLIWNPPKFCSFLVSVISELLKKRYAKE